MAQAARQNQQLLNAYKTRMSQCHSGRGNQGATDLVSYSFSLKLITKINFKLWITHCSHYYTDLESHMTGQW